MTTFQEINDLRKKGQIDDAYRLATKALTDAPTDVWIKRAMGWVLYEYLNQSATMKTTQEFISWFKSLVDLAVDNNETILLNSVAWAVRKMLSDAEGKEVSSRFLDELLALLKSFDFPKSEKSYSALLSAALRLENKWPDFYQFVDWWGWDNLQPDDYNEMHMDNGRSIMSLAERAIIAYAKSLLKNAGEEGISEAIPRIKDMIVQHPAYVYPPYYLAKLYLKVNDKESAFSFLKPFAKTKQKDFWVWQLLADTQNDEEARLSFICKALLCGGKEEMLVSLREDAAFLFAKLGYQSEAKMEALMAVETRKRNNWNMTNGLRAIQVEKWFVNVRATDSNRSFYLKHTSKAETLILGELINLVCLVTYVNEAKQMVSFVTENKGQGFFKIPKGSPKLSVNKMIEIAVNDNVEGRAMVRTVKIVEGMDNPSFFKSYEGSLKMLAGFGLVEGIFVEPKLLSGRFDREKVGGIAVVSYDKKKNRWGWKALTMNSLK